MLSTTKKKKILEVEKIYAKVPHICLYIYNKICTQKGLN